jgi:rod shape-determining protein MreC
LRIDRRDVGGESRAHLAGELVGQHLEGTGLHSVQRGVLDVVSPIQEGASKALKPVRDLFGWAGDTFHAKGQLKDVRKDRDALRAQVVQLQARVREDAQLKSQINLNDTIGLTDNGPVAAHVPVPWPSPSASIAA